MSSLSVLNLTDCLHQCQKLGGMAPSLWRCPAPRRAYGRGQGFMKSQDRFSCARTSQMGQALQGVHPATSGAWYRGADEPRGNNGNGWMWQEPVMDASLSSADRVVLALARAAANVSDKAAAERAAASHGLHLVTTSDLCVAPLLPPFGATLEDDGEEGDGMALAPPQDQSTARPLAAAKRAAKAGVPSALLSSILHLQPAGNGSGSGSATQPAPGPAGGSTRLEHLAQAVSEGGGGDTEDEGINDERSEFSGFIASTRNSIGGRGSPAASRGAGQVTHGSVGAAQGLWGAAAAALSRVARAASSAAESQAPVGRAAAGAATAAAHAAQAAVARAAKATSQMLPHYGDPSSSWLVADDPRGGVRYIVVAAGPDLRGRTVRDLATDLVTFETYNLGAKVNRRVYAEATALYSRFMPLVMDFLEAVPDGNICFGGQGMGGSLAVLLQLMCCHRGLRFAKLLPAVAVDSPAVLCQVPLHQRRMWGRDLQVTESQDILEDVLEDLMCRSILEELGLPQDAVRNILLAHSPTPLAPLLTPSTQQQLQLPAATALHTPALPYRHAAPQGPEPLVFLGADAAAVAGDSAGGAGPAQAQVFRLVGKVVHVDTIGSASSRAVAATAAKQPYDVITGSPQHQHLDLHLADGGSMDVMAVADGGAASASMVGSPKRLDVAMVGSIAGAAASAAASAAVERLMLVGGGAARLVSGGGSGGGGGVSQLAAMAFAGVPTEMDGKVKGAGAGAGAMAAATSVMAVPAAEMGVGYWQQHLLAGDFEDEEEDVSAWGV